MKEQPEEQPKTEAELRQVVRGIVGDYMDERQQELAAQAEKSAPVWRNRTVILSFVLGVLVATFVLSTFLPRIISNDLRTLPSELVGVWSTTDTRYVDRAFEIKKDSLIFQTGGTSSTMHSIRRVDVEQNDSTTLYLVDYLNNEDVYTFSFYFDADSDTIRFQNQLEMVWTR